MAADKESTSGRRKTTGKKVMIWALAAVVILAAVVVFAVPAFVSSARGRRIILAKINEATDGKTDFGSLSMSWWRGIRVTDFSFNDKVGRTSVEIEKIATRPHYGSLLLGSVSLGETRIDRPRVEISLAGKTEGVVAGAEGARKGPFAPPIEEIDLVVSNGSVKVTDAQAGSVEVRQINSKLNLQPAGRQTSFNLSMAVAGKGESSQVRAEGKVVPDRQAGWGLEGASGDFAVEVNGLELESLGPIFVLAGVAVEAKGRISGNVEGAVKDGRFEKLTGTIRGSGLEVGGEMLKGDRVKTSVLDVGVKLRGEKERINIEDLRVSSDWAAAELKGVVPMTLKTLADFVRPGSQYSLKGSFECKVAEALSQLSNTVGLREGMKVTSGQLAGKVETLSEGDRKWIEGRASLVQLGGEVGGEKIALSEPVTAEAAITSADGDIKFEKLGLSSSFAKINCTGRSDSLKYESRINLAKVQSELGQFVKAGKYKLDGELSGKGDISIGEDRIAIAGLSALEGFKITSAEANASEPKAEVDFSLAVGRKDNVMDVNFIRTRASFGQINIQDAVIPLSKKAAKPMSLEVGAKGIALEKLSPFGVLLGYLPKEMVLAGTADSRVSIRSKKDSYFVSTDATKISGLKLSYPGQKPFEQEEVAVVFDGEISPAKVTMKYQVSSPQIKIKGNYEKVTQGDTTKLQGAAEGEYDWAAVSAIAAPYLPKGLVLQGQRKDTFSFSSEYPAADSNKLAANLNTKAKLGFEQADYMGLKFGKTETAIEVEKGVLKIGPFSTKVNNGELNFGAAADFKQKPALLEIPKPTELIKNVEINDETARMLLAYVNPVFANAVDVSGVANFSCERLALPLGGGVEKEKIQVIGTIALDSVRLSPPAWFGELASLVGLKLKEQRIRVHPTRFILWDGFLRYDDMQIDVGDNPFNFKGAIGLDNSLNMTVTLPYTIDGKSVKTGQTGGSARMALPLKGTITKPEFDFGKLIELQLKQRLEDELKKRLDGLFK